MKHNEHSSGKKRREIASAIVGVVIALMALFMAFGPAEAQTIFDEELQKVDANARLHTIIDPSYGLDEWSINGLTLRGGSDLPRDFSSTVD